MKYENIVKGKFIERPNRFIAQVEINGMPQRVHVKNTGRCKELLIKGTTVYLEDFDGRMGTRKLRYSLIGVEKGNLLINMDSQAPNKVCEEALLSGCITLPDMGKLKVVKREKTFGDSRFDFYLEDEDGTKGWLEVKGVTLEDDGNVRFPDAPTERGVKHIKELCRAVDEGYKGYILFVIQIEGMKLFMPNYETHEAFGDALRFAQSKGVHVLAYDCVVEFDELRINGAIDIDLKKY